MILIIYISIFLNLNSMELSSEDYQNNVEFSFLEATKMSLFCERCNKEIFAFDKICHIDKATDEHIKWHLANDEEFRACYLNPNFDVSNDSEEKRYLTFKYPVKHGYGFHYNLFDSLTIQCNKCGKCLEVREYSYKGTNTIIEKIDRSAESIIPFKKVHTHCSENP